VAPHLPPALAFLVGYGFDAARLAVVVERASALGMFPVDVLIAEGPCSEDDYYGLLAREAGVPFLETFEVDSDHDLSRLFACSVARLRHFSGPDVVTAPRGAAVELWLGERGAALAQTRRFALTTPGKLESALVRALGERLAAAASQDLPDRRPDFSARGRPTSLQFAALLLVELLLVVGLCMAPLDTTIAVGAIASVAFLLQMSLRWASKPLDHRLRAGRGPALADGDLPVYTILVPLYREAEVLPDLLAALDRFDYPKAKLDIKLLVEAADVETRRALRRLKPGAPVQVVTCPPGYPRTKPRALNIGLRLARGSRLVIYDAEDRPEPTQLRQAASAFQHATGNVACLQAALAVDNAGESWISRCFALEYAELFDVALPGFAQLGLPMPLGGTSNHFRTDILREVGAWDAWNVTEDADLGLRLARRGYQVQNLPSTTWEEAPISIRAWLPQRTRWIKGWLQTSFVHGLPSFRHLREVGPLGTVAIFCHSYALTLSCLGWPVFSLGLVWALCDALWSEEAAGAMKTGAVTLAMVVMLLGAATVLRGLAIGAARRGLPLGVRDVMLLPPYFLLVNLAAWRAVWELTTAPHHWSKTQHGVSRRRAET
jgi:hypothetical protein